MGFGDWLIQNVLPALEVCKSLSWAQVGPHFLCVCLNKRLDKYAAPSHEGVVWGGEIISSTYLINNWNDQKNVESNKMNHLSGGRWSGQWIEEQNTWIFCFLHKVYSN